MTNPNALTELTNRLSDFAENRDRSPDVVREINAQLERDFAGGEAFPDAEAYTELEVAAACYKPGGGQFMYDEEQMALVCRYVLARLDNLGKTTR